MDAPRPVRVDEFAEVMDFVDRVFRPGQKGRFILQRQYPHAYQRRPEYARRLILIRDQREIVGALAIHPLDLRLEEVRLRAGGIGVVGTRPDRRGEGIMSALLEDAIRRMQREGYPLAVLWGDRQRYGWFGWENGGVQHGFELTLRQLGKPTPAERRLPIERLALTPAMCRRLQRLGQAHPYWTARSLRDIPLLVARDGRQAWGCQEGPRFAYLVLQRATGRWRPRTDYLDEAGGDPELARAMLRVLMARFKLERLQAIARTQPRGDRPPPARQRPLDAPVRRHGEDRGSGPAPAGARAAAGAPGQGGRGARRLPLPHGRPGRPPRIGEGEEPPDRAGRAGDGQPVLRHPAPGRAVW